MGSSPVRLKLENVTLHQKASRLAGERVRSVRAPLPRIEGKAGQLATDKYDPEHAYAWWLYWGRLCVCGSEKTGMLVSSSPWRDVHGCSWKQPVP